MKTKKNIGQRNERTRKTRTRKREENGRRLTRKCSKTMKIKRRGKKNKDTENNKKLR